MDRDWKHGVTAAVHVTLFGRFYERFADHAVEIGRRVLSEATGNTPPDNCPPRPMLSVRLSSVVSRDDAVRG